MLNDMNTEQGGTFLECQMEYFYLKNCGSFIRHFHTDKLINTQSYLYINSNCFEQFLTRGLFILYFFLDFMDNIFQLEF